MFCPNCRYEFRRGFTKCNECGVDLVDTLKPNDQEAVAGKTSAQMVSPVLLWHGFNSDWIGEIRLALESAGIPYNRDEIDARLIYMSVYSPLEIWIPAANFPEAKKLLDEILSSKDSAASDGNSDDTTDELPAEDGEGADDIRSEDVARELDPQDATAEIWSGGEANAAEMLKSCLAEIGIACYVDRPESGNFAVRVLPDDEKPARDVVRQVVEGVPPE